MCVVSPSTVRDCTSTSNTAIPPGLTPSPVKVTTSLPELSDMAKPAMLPDTTLVRSATLTESTKVRNPDEVSRLNTAIWSGRGGGEASERPPERSVFPDLQNTRYDPTCHDYDKLVSGRVGR